MVESTSGTLSFPSYLVNEDPSLTFFQAYLTSIAGRSKTEAQAEQIAKDVPNSCDLPAKIIQFQSGNGCWRKT